MALRTTAYEELPSTEINECFGSDKRINKMECVAMRTNGKASGET
jgi:hypothetical protein